MQLCRVTGNAVATVKAPALRDFKLLRVKPEGKGGIEFVAVDTLGAGEGDLVLVARGRPPASSRRRREPRPTRRSSPSWTRSSSVTAELRAWVEIDSMQSQWAAYVAQTCQGDPPHAGMAQLYVEVAPASRVFALVNAAVKHAAGALRAPGRRAPVRDARAARRRSRRPSARQARRCSSCSKRHPPTASRPRSSRTRS